MKHRLPFKNNVKVLTYHGIIIILLHSLMMGASGTSEPCNKCKTAKLGNKEDLECWNNRHEEEVVARTDFTRATWFHSKTNATEGAVLIKQAWPRSDVSENVQSEVAHLTLTSVKYEHQGYFFFMTVNSRRVFCDLYLNVLSKPKVSCETSIKAKEGDKVNLTCVTSGNPKPSVWWSRLESTEQGTKLVKMVDGNTLIIKNIKRYHHGKYVCTAKNSEGEKDDTTLVNITFMPDIEVYESLVEVQKGNSVTLMCRVTANPTPKLIWTKRDSFDRIRSDQEYTVKEDVELLKSHLTQYILLTINKAVYNEDFSCRLLSFGLEYTRNVTVIVRDIH